MQTPERPEKPQEIVVGHDLGTEPQPAVTVPISRGYHCLVDAEDYDKVAAITWTANVDRDGRVYAVGNCGGKRMPMHRFLMNAPPGVKVDHKNSETLTNCKWNLRIGTNTQNIRNQKPHRDKTTSKFKGVYRPKGVKKFVAQIEVDRRKICIGRFDNEEDAARAYDSKARELHGEFARTNFPEVAA